MTRERSTSRVLLVVVVLAALLGLVGLVALDPFGWRADRELVRALTRRGRVAVAGGKALLGLHADGAELVDAAQSPAVAHALSGSDAGALVRALEQVGASAVLVETASAHEGAASVRAQLARFSHVQGLRGLYLSPAAALYAPDVTHELSPTHVEALATVARALVAGSRPPKTSSFPEPLRRLRPVEVMVLLRRDQEPRLWRSSRGSSIAAALVTAATVARQRWQEREQAMGGALDHALPHLYVDVALLEDDGTLGERDPGFVDRVFVPHVHGVAYERTGAWRYLLPAATFDEGHGRASRAYRKLFADDGLPVDSFQRHELRLYRLVVQTLATSAPVRHPDDGVSDVHAPGEVLGTP